MPFLAVGSTTIPRVNAAPRSIEDGIDRERAFDNTLLAIQIGVPKSSWTVTVFHCTSAQRTTILSALLATPPVSCSGDLIGSTVSCHVEINSDEPVLGILPRVWNISFTLMAA